MNISRIELALGTAQFGMKYGISGRDGPVSEKEVRDILARAWALGIRTIDTASVYGDIEERINALTDGYSFQVVSKIPALPSKISRDEVEDYVSESINKMRSSLGSGLSTVLFHNSDNLLSEKGDIAWQAAVKSTHNTPIKLGASCYSPHDMALLRARYPMDAVQLPGNAFDQRLQLAVVPGHIELHLRSVFLQGVLLLSSKEASVKLPRAMTYLSAWRDWCRERDLTPLQAALGLAKGLPHVRYCVVGVDALSQLEEIAEAWSSVVALKAPELATERLDVIDPRYWNRCASACFF